MGAAASDIALHPPAPAMNRALLASRSSILLGLVFLFLLAGTLPASAHVRDTAGYSTIHGDGREISYELSLEYEILAKAVDLGPDARGAVDDASRLAALEAGKANLSAYLYERGVIYLDGAACEPHLDGVSTTTRDENPYVQMDLTYTCPGESGQYQLTYDVFSDVDAISDEHTNIVEYQIGADSGRTVMDGGHNELLMGENSVIVSSSRFALMGIEHLLFGLDHVLFVVAVMLGATSLRNLVGVVSMFTLAHSVSLITALLGWVQVGASIVEPLIALSITFVAIENLLGAPRRRHLVVFLFGLLHGLGFAGSLKITDDVSWNLVASLLSFNIGIEAGQVLLLLVIFPLLLLVRRSRFSAPVVRGATIVVAVFGLIWFLERFFFV